MTLNSKIRIAITDNRTALRCRFLIQLLELCGAEVVLIPVYLADNQTTDAHYHHIETLMQSCQGLVLPGNKCDIPPYIYGVEDIHPETQKRLRDDIKFLRFETEMRMAAFAVKNKLPIIGICGGMQVINVLLGGSLIQHIPAHPKVKKAGIPHYDPDLKSISEEILSEFEENFIEHIETGQPENIFGKSHPMAVEADSYLGKLYKAKDPEIDLTKIKELSIHHQGCMIKNLAPDAIPTALSPDGIIEAFEIKDYNQFCLLTQFHWEANVSGIAKAAIMELLKNVNLPD